MKPELAEGEEEPEELDGPQAPGPQAPRARGSCSIDFGNGFSLTVEGDTAALMEAASNLAYNLAHNIASEKAFSGPKKDEPRGVQ